MKLPMFELRMQKKTCQLATLSRVWQATRRALSLEHSPAHQFAFCQWQVDDRPTLAYLIYRWLLLLTVISVAAASFAFQTLPRQYDGPKVELNYFKWFIYFTNWGFMLIILQSALAVAVVHRYKKRTFNLPCDEDETPTLKRPRTPVLCRAYWLSHTIATDLAFVITLIYWTLVHDPRLHEINTLNLLVHGGNSVAMLAELIVTAHPFRAAHALYGAGAGLVYGVFSAFYWGVGGTDRVGNQAVYPALNWNKPSSAFGFVALCAFVLLCSHAVATCIAAARTRVASRFARPRPHLDRLSLPTH